MFTRCYTLKSSIFNQLTISSYNCKNIKNISEWNPESAQELWHHPITVNMVVRPGMTMCWSHITGHFNKKKIPIKFTTFILALNIWFYLKSVPKCPVSALMLKIILGLHLARFCLSHDFRVEQNSFGWNTFSEWYTRKTDGLRHFWESLCSLM